MVPAICRNAPWAQSTTMEANGCFHRLQMHPGLQKAKVSGATQFFRREPKWQNDKSPNGIWLAFSPFGLGALVYTSHAISNISPFGFPPDWARSSFGLGAQTAGEVLGKRP